MAHPTRRETACREICSAIDVHGLLRFATEFVMRAAERMPKERLINMVRSVRRRLDLGKAPNGEPPIATDTEPGSRERVAIYMLRREAGMELHRDDDAKNPVVPIPVVKDWSGEDHSRRDWD